MQETSDGFRSVDQEHLSPLGCTMQAPLNSIQMFNPLFPSTSSWTPFSTWLVNVLPRWQYLLTSTEKNCLRGSGWGVE